MSDSRDINEQKYLQEAYENLVNHSLQAFVIFQDDKIVFVSSEDQPISGYTKEELYAMSPGQFFDLIPEEDREERKRIFNERLSGADLPERVEFRILRKDGEIRWVESSPQVISYYGKPAMQTAYIDITDRKQAEIQLQKNEARLREAEKVANLGHWELDLQTNKLYWSEEIFRIFEIPPSDTESSYEDFLAVVHPDDREIVDQAYKESLREKAPYSIDHRIRFPDGKVKYVHEQGVTHYDERGNAIRSLGTVQDITDRKQVEEQLRKLSRAVESAPVSIVITDKNGNIEYVNPYFSFLTGYETEEVFGKNPRIMQSGNTSREIYSELWETILGGDTWKGELVNQKKNGDLYIEAAEISPIVDDDGEVTHFVAIKQDITERKRAEFKLQESEQRYRALVELAPEAVYVHRDGRFIYTNQAGVELMGASSPSELLGTPIMERVHPDFHETVRQRVQESVSNRMIASTLEEVFIRMDGSLVDVEVVATSIPYEGQSAMLVIVRDITERKWAEEAMQKNEDALRRRAEEMIALQQTVLGITSSTSLSELLKSIVERATGLLDASSGGLYLTESENKCVRCVVSYNTAKDFTGTRLAYGEGAAGYVAQTGEPLLIDDYHKWSGKADVYKDERSFQAIISAPMIWRGEVLGVLHMLREKDRGKFVQEELKLLTQFADHAAVAVQNTRLYESLQKSEERYRNIYERVDDIIYETDFHGYITGVSPSIEKHTGYKSEEIVGKKVASFFDNSDEYEALVSAMEPSGMAYNFEVSLRKKSGEVSDVSISAHTVFDLDGNPIKTEGILHDITERKRMEEELRHREQEFSSLVENTTDLIARFDTNLRYIFCNSEFERRGSRPISEYIGRTILEVGGRVKESMVSLDRAARRTLETGEIQQIEQDFLTVSGLRHHQIRITPERNNEGSIVSLLTVGRDITDRKQMEDALLESETRLFSIFNSSRDAILVVKDGVFVMVNPAFVRNHGYDDPDEFVGRSVADFVSPEDREMVIENARKRARGEPAPTFYEVVAMRRDETRFIAELNVSTYELGGEIYTVATERDITERKEAEQREYEQRTLAEGLRDTAEALSSSLELDDILDKILDKVWDVVKYDAICVLWVEDGNQMRYMKLKGYGAEENLWLQEQSFDVDDFVTYQQAIETQKPIIVSNTKSDPDWISLPKTEWIQSHAGIPVVVDGKVVAVVNLDSKEPGFYTEKHTKNLQAFANQVAIAIRNSMLYKEIQNLATVDELTGLYNRRGFFEVCRREVGRLQRYNRAFSILFVDIDHFKNFNDRYSYEIGDKVLHLVAETLQGSVREIDVVGRYGGEEMVIMLPEIGRKGAYDTAERLRQKIEKIFVLSDQEELKVTVSVGVATIIPVKGETIPTNAEHQGRILDELIAKAGEALHIAKREGRNRVEIYTDAD